MQQTAGDRAAVISPSAWGPPLPLLDGDGEFRPIVWPGTGATSRSMHHIRLSAGVSTVELQHPTDAAYYVVSGTVRATDEAGGETFELREGAMIHVDAGTTYRLTAAADADAVVLGGPCPVDPGLYAGPATG